MRRGRLFAQPKHLDHSFLRLPAPAYRAEAQLDLQLLNSVIEFHTPIPRLECGAIPRFSSLCRIAALSNEPAVVPNRFDREI